MLRYRKREARSGGMLRIVVYRNFRFVSVLMMSTLSSFIYFPGEKEGGFEG